MSNAAYQGGKEALRRPNKSEIWTNRRINLKNFDRMHDGGWKYLKNKFLDLGKDDDYKILSVLPER